MMSLSNQERRHHLLVPALLFILLVLVWYLRLFVIYKSVVELLIPSQSQGPSQESQGSQDYASGEQAFLQQAMAVEFPAPLDYEAIRAVCARSEFRPGLLFSCEGQHGGIGMVRNQMLKCVRYAIHAGAALVIPSMALRNVSDLTDIETDTEVPLDYLLDRNAFVSRLVAGCPGLRLFDRAEDFPSYSNLSGAPLDLVGDQFEPQHPPAGLQNLPSWRPNFDAWLLQQGRSGRLAEPVLPLHPEHPVHVRMGQSFLEYPVLADGAAFAREFGKILSFRNDTRALAAQVLWQLRTRFALAIDPAIAIQLSGGYYGAHLRLEADALAAWPPETWRFSRMQDQFEEHFRNIDRTGLRVVYVASGDPSVVDRFAAALAARPASANVAVVTKHDVLTGPSRQQLDGMSFDQQALVDFLVLSKATAFMGVASSSFPWTVALRRHELSRYTGFANEGSDLLRDEYSIIMGMAADYVYIDQFATAIWP